MCNNAVCITNVPWETTLDYLLWMDYKKFKHLDIPCNYRERTLVGIIDNEVYLAIKKPRHQHPLRSLQEIISIASQLLVEGKQTEHSISIFKIVLDMKKDGLW